MLTYITVDTHRQNSSDEERRRKGGGKEEVIKAIMKDVVKAAGIFKGNDFFREFFSAAQHFHQIKACRM